MGWKMGRRYALGVWWCWYHEKRSHLPCKVERLNEYINNIYMNQVEFLVWLILHLKYAQVIAAERTDPFKQQYFVYNNIHTRYIS